jgi:hypothetical protein
VLDDATSAIDIKGEREINASIALLQEVPRC